LFLVLLVHVIVPHIISYKVRDKRISSTTRFDCCNSEKKPKQRGKEVLKKEKSSTNKKNKRKGKEEDKKSEVLAPLYPCAELYCFLLEISPGHI